MDKVDKGVSVHTVLDYKLLQNDFFFLHLLPFKKRFSFEHENNAKWEITGTKIKGLFTLKRLNIICIIVDSFCLPFISFVNKVSNIDTNGLPLA